jgi:hypothetical protein
MRVSAAIWASGIFRFSRSALSSDATDAIADWRIPVNPSVELSYCHSENVILLFGKSRVKQLKYLHYFSFFDEVQVLSDDWLRFSR